MTKKPNDELPIPSLWLLVFLATLFFPVAIISSLDLWLRVLPREETAAARDLKFADLSHLAQNHDDALTEYWAAECLAITLGRWPTEDEIAKAFRSNIPF